MFHNRMEPHLDLEIGNGEYIVGWAEGESKAPRKKLASETLHEDAPRECSPDSPGRMESPMGSEGIVSTITDITEITSPDMLQASPSSRRMSITSIDMSSVTAAVSNTIGDINGVYHSQTTIKDDSHVFSFFLVTMAALVATVCGAAAFTLHLAVGSAGCLAGVNGCHDHILLDLVKPLGVGRSLFFILSCSLSGLICSLIIYSPYGNGIAKKCKGGGSADTKIIVSSGAKASGFIVIGRILLAAIYMGGGNPLGTEGPMIHLSVAAATWLVSLYGRRRRKFLCTFAVIGAAAGISAGFNVLVTGFVYVIEELTRSLSRKLALILAFAACFALLVKEVLDKIIHLWIHPPHGSLMPEDALWRNMTDSDLRWGLLLCFPIGVLTGVAGWVWTHFTWALLNCLKPENQSAIFRKVFPQRLHLAGIGILVGCLGALAYEVTGMNGVWGTTIGAIPEAVDANLRWEHALLLFAAKFFAFMLAVAASGPGGLLVPSLVTGGLLGLTVARVFDSSRSLTAACAVMGMGSMFASIMHMPLTGVIIIFELTKYSPLMLHVGFANFIAFNVSARLPHGAHSFVHRQLEQDPTWHKLEARDFIETDDQEMEANLALVASIRSWMLNDEELVHVCFVSWVEYYCMDDKKKFSSNTSGGEDDEDVDEDEEEEPAPLPAQAPAGPISSFVRRFPAIRSMSSMFASNASMASNDSFARQQSTGSLASLHSKLANHNSQLRSGGSNVGPGHGNLLMNQLALRRPNSANFASNQSKDDASSVSSPGSHNAAPVREVSKDALPVRERSAASLPSMPSMPSSTPWTADECENASNTSPPGPGKASASPTSPGGRKRRSFRNSQSTGSFQSLKSRSSVGSPPDTARSEPLTEEDKTRRREVKNQWTAVSMVIPGLNLRVWKSLGKKQRAALAEAASLLTAAPSSPCGQTESSALPSPGRETPASTSPKSATSARNNKPPALKPANRGHKPGPLISCLNGPTTLEIVYENGVAKL